MAAVSLAGGDAKAEAKESSRGAGGNGAVAGAKVSTSPFRIVELLLIYYFKLPDGHSQRIDYLQSYEASRELST